MPTELEYSGAAVALPELTEIHIERAIPGGRYGVRSFNTRLCAAFSTPTDDEAAIGDRLKADMVAAGMRVTGSNPLLLTTQPGISSGLRIDSSPGSYISNVTPGVESTPKQIRVSVPVGASGGTWTLTFDFGDGDETTADLGPTALPASIVTAIEGLATPLPGEVTVYLENPGNSLTSRSYLISIGGTLAGVDWTVTASGAELEGVGRIEARIEQYASGSSQELQALWFGGRSESRTNVFGVKTRLGFTRGGVYSDFVYGVNDYDTDNPGTSTHGGVNTLAAIQAAIDQVCGVGNVVATLYVRPRGGVITLLWNVPGPQEQVSLFGEVYTNIIGFGQDAGAPASHMLACQAETLRQGGANQNEFILVDVSQLNNNSTYNVTYNSTTVAMNNTGSYFIDPEPILETDWDSLTGSGATTHLLPSNCRTNLNGTNYYGWRALYFVEFTGANANTDIADVTVVNPVGTVSRWQITQGLPFGNMIQSLVIRADSGTFTLSVDGAAFTSALTVGLSAGTLQTALRGLTAIGAGNCDVTGTGSREDPFLIEMVSGLAGDDIALLTATIGSLIGGADPALMTITEALQGTAQVDQLWIDPNATGGFLRATSQGDFSGNIAWDAAAATVETALELINAVAAWGLTVSGEDGGPYLLTWTGLGLAPALTLSQETLTVPVSSLIRLERVQEAEGPAIWRCAENWDPPQVPGTGDTAILRYGNLKIIEGLRQECSWTRSADLLALGGGDFVVGQIVRLQISAGGTFPTATISGAGHTLSIATDYTIIGIDRFAQVCQIALSLSGAAVVLTSAGTGTFRIGVVLAEYQQYGTFTGDVGLSERIQNRNEERTRFLTIGATAVDLGLGAVGAGSPLQNLDLGAQPTTIQQFKSGTSRLTGEMATTLRVNNAASPLKVLGGYCAVSPSDPDTDSSVLGAVEVRNANLLLGPVEIASYDGSGDVLRSPEGFVCLGKNRRN